MRRLDSGDGELLITFCAKGNSFEGRLIIIVETKPFVGRSACWFI